MPERKISYDEALRLLDGSQRALDSIRYTIEDLPVQGGVLTARKISGCWHYILIEKEEH